MNTAVELSVQHSEGRERLDYAPKLKDIEITDIKKGLGEFTPKPDKPVSFNALKSKLKGAGYVLVLPAAVVHEDSATLVRAQRLNRIDL